MVLKKFVTGPLQVNCYCVYAEGSTTCAVIDPGDAKPVLAYLEQENLRCTHILLTHGHFDHMMGVVDLRAKTGAKVFVHQKDEFLLERDDKEAASVGIRAQACKADAFFAGGDTVSAGGLDFRVLETPGHTPGGVCLYLEKEHVLFSGDTLFHMSVGRTDLPSSVELDLRQSVLNVVCALPDETDVYPGHMEETQLGMEKQRNPYIRYWKEMMA